MRLTDNDIAALIEATSMLLAGPSFADNEGAPAGSEEEKDANRRWDRMMAVDNKLRLERERREQKRGAR